MRSVAIRQDIQEIIEKDGPIAALQFEVDMTRKYIPQRFFDEIKGLSDGLNGTVSYDDALRFHLFPELIKASCSMFGAWGPALANFRWPWTGSLDRVHEPRELMI